MLTRATAVARQLRYYIIKFSPHCLNMDRNDPFLESTLFSVLFCSCQPTGYLMCTGYPAASVETLALPIDLPLIFVVNYERAS